MPEATAATENKNPIDDALDKALAKADEGQSLAPRPDLTPSQPAEGSDKPESGTRERGERGRFVSKKPDDDEGEEIEDDDDDPLAKKHSDDDIRAAVKAAQRISGKDKLPKSLAALFDSGDSDTIAHYLKLAKVQQDGDEFTTKHKKLQQEFDTLKSKPAQQGDDAKATATAAPEVDSLASYLAESLADPEAATKVRESLAGLQKSFTSELAKRDQQNADLLKQVEAIGLERARDALISDYPEAKAADVWKDALKMRADFPITESRPDLATQMDHILRVLTAPDRANAAKAERDKRRTLRDKGSPDSPAGDRTKPGAKSSTTAVALQDAFLDALEKNDESKVKEVKAELKSRFNAV